MTAAASSEAAAQARPAGAVDVAPVNPDFFIPGRFAGKTVIITGSAQGMGAVAARRAAREGANVVGVDWLEEKGAAVIDAIRAEGGRATFVYGDVSETKVCEKMVAAAVREYGALHYAINNAGVMDAIFPGDAIDYQKQKDLVFSPIHGCDQAGDLAELFARSLRRRAALSFA